jgi:hypothetical protein
LRIFASTRSETPTEPVQKTPAAIFGDRKDFSGDHTLTEV